MIMPSLASMHAGLVFLRGCCADIDQLAARLCAVLDSTARLIACRRRAARVTVWTVTTDGDNCPISTTVHASEAEALARVRADLEAGDMRRRAELRVMDRQELSEEWSRVTDGACSIESHELDA